MNIQDIIKLQMVSQFGAHHQTASQHGGTSPLAMLHQFLFMLFMSVLDDVGKALPKLCQEIKSFFVQKATQKVQDTIAVRPQDLKDTSILLSKRHNTSSLVMTRTFVNTSESASSSSGTADRSHEESDGMVDSILAHISKLDNVPVLKLIDRGQIMISYKDKPVQVAKDVFVKIDSIATTAGDAVSSVRLTLLSNTLSAAELAGYAKSVHAKHQEELKNSLGNNIYFFDHKSKDNSPPMLPPGCSDADTILNHRRMLISTAPKNLSFTMTPFYSNKRFSNIFGKEIRAIEKRVRFFLENREWYDSKGVPYQLGVLLSGIPGAGKTSAIRAIANLTKRHIINVNFANIATATQLKNLFYCDKLAVYSDSSLSSNQAYFIPIEQRLYVLEEIDAIGDIVRQRTSSDSNRAAVHDELTLAEILTVLDGTMEVPGRIVIMTSNHPEVLDRALIRPGRIDVQVHFDNADRGLIAEMFEAYLDAPFPPELLDALPDKVLTPAEVGQVIFRNFELKQSVKEHGGRDIEKILRDLDAAAAAKRPPAKQVDAKEEASDLELAKESEGVAEGVPAKEEEHAEVVSEAVVSTGALAKLEVLEDARAAEEFAEQVGALARLPAQVLETAGDYTFNNTIDTIMKSPLFNDKALPSQLDTAATPNPVKSGVDTSGDSRQVFGPVSFADSPLFNAHSTLPPATRAEPTAAVDGIMPFNFGSEFCEIAA